MVFAVCTLQSYPISSMNISLSFTRFLPTPTLTPPRASISPLPTRRPPPLPRRQKPPPRRRRLPPPNPPLPLPSSCSLECPHFESCSGCTHEVDLQRPEIVDEAEEFFKGFGVDDFSFHSGKLLGWRCRAKLVVRGSSADPVIGLYQEGTHNVVDIPDCKAHHPNINVAIELLKQGIVELNVEPYDEDAGTGELRYVQMAVTTYNTSIPQSERYKNGKVQVTLVWNSRSEISPSFQKLEALANFLWKTYGPKCDFHLIHSVWANFQISTDNVIFGNRWNHLVGNKEFWEHIGGIDASLDPSSFGQANTRAFDSILHKLQKYVPYGSSVAYLYGGSGIIGLSLAATRKCRFVKCIEVSKESKPSFERTLSRLPNYVDCNISWHHADASDSTVPPKHHHAAVSNRTVKHCCLEKLGSWIRRMDSIFSQAHRASRSWRYSKGVREHRSRKTSLSRRRRRNCYQSRCHGNTVNLTGRNTMQVLPVKHAAASFHVVESSSLCDCIIHGNLSYLKYAAGKGFAEDDISGVKYCQAVGVLTRETLS